MAAFILMMFLGLAGLFFLGPRGMLIGVVVGGFVGVIGGKG
jgi:hypothetical protein